MTSRLSDIKTVEVSLVEKAANKRRFLLFKSEDGKGGKENPPPKAANNTLPKQEEAKEVATEDVLKDSLKDLPEGVRGQIEALWKEQNTKVQDALKKAEDLETALKKERDERRTRDFVEKAKGLDRLPVKPEELAELLKSLADKAPEEFEQIEKLFSTVNEQIAESGLFDEIGSSGSNSTGGGAWAKIEAAAMGEVQKNAGITKADAVAKVLKEHPDLYNEYLTERTGK